MGRTPAALIGGRNGENHRLRPGAHPGTLPCRVNAERETGQGVPHTKRSAAKLGLKWADVDLKLGTATVRRSLVRTKTGPRFHEPKTERSIRTIKQPDEAIQELKAHRARQRRLQNTAGTHGLHDLSGRENCHDGDRGGPLRPAARRRAARQNGIPFAQEPAAGHVPGNARPRLSRVVWLPVKRGLQHGHHHPPRPWHRALQRGGASQCERP